MTEGETQREAAEQWLATYGAAFTGTQPEYMEFSHVQLQSDKTVVTYKQFLGEVPVQSGSITVVTNRSSNGHRAVYASARLADTPLGHLPVPLVSQAQALAAAQQHPAATGLGDWREPELIYIYSEDENGNAPCQLTWRCTGMSAEGGSTTFHVSALSGNVIRYYSNTVNADVSGTVRAWLTPGTMPDPWGYVGYSGSGTFGCPNSVTSGHPLHHVRVRALDTVTHTPISGAEAFTDTNGDFTVPIQSGLTVDLEFYLIGPYWDVRDRRFGVPPFALADPEMVVGVSSSGTLSSPVVFNTPTSQPPSVPPDFDDHYRTAHVNLHYHVDKTRRYFLDRLVIDNTPPGLYTWLYAVANDPFIQGNAGMDPSGPAISFGSWPYTRIPPNDTYPNTAYSTWISHEYAHFILHFLREITATAPGQLSFHEGFADAIALYAQSPDSGPVLPRWGDGFYGCGTTDPSVPGPVRRPLFPSRSYPLCEQHTSLASAYVVGAILSGIWLDLYYELEITYGTEDAMEIARQLQVDWAMLTDGGESDSIACVPHTPDNGRSAHLGTFIEVLTADGGGDDPSMAPHFEEICAAFAAHGIESELCGEHAGRGAGLIDCNRDGTVNIGDVSCFQNRYVAGDPRADCDDDGRLTPRDLTCFVLRLQESSSR